MADGDGSTKRCLIVTRKEAKAAGQRFYFTGNPCNHGHVELRHVGSGSCVECQRIRARDWKNRNKTATRQYARAYYCEHKEEARIRDRRRAKKHPGRTSTHARAWERAHLEETRARKRAWKAANGHKIREYARKQYWKDPVKAAAKYHRRRALKLKNGGSFTSADISAIRMMQRDKCAICRLRLKGRGEIDHIIPLIRGGSNDRRNLQLLCDPCNGRKSGRDPVLFMQQLGRLL